MRNPLRKAGISFGLIILGVGAALAAIFNYGRLGNAAGTIIGVLGFAIAMISFVVLFWSLFAAVGYARLRAGRGIIARWHVTPAEWERFRAFDSTRAAQAPELRNELRVRREIPPEGVDVIVGCRQLIVDRSYHALRAWASPSFRGVNWVSAPADPECLEFSLVYPRGRYGGTFTMTLRVPVPAQARADGVRVFEHYRGSHK